MRTALAHVDRQPAEGIARRPAASRTRIGANDQLFGADAYRHADHRLRRTAPPCALGDVANVFDDVENNRVAAWTDGKRAVLMIIRRQPARTSSRPIERDQGARCRSSAQSISPAIDVDIALDRTQTIRASVHDVELTLMRQRAPGGRWWSSCSCAASRATRSRASRCRSRSSGTFGVMYLLGYSLDNLSLMALTISTGLRRRRRHRRDREHHALHRARRAARSRRRSKGAQQIGFTIVSITASLLAVFIPILLMGGIVGRLFREFAVTLSVAIADLGARVADADADDVLARSCGRRGTTAAAGASHASPSAAFDALVARLRARARLGARPPRG